MLIDVRTKDEYNLEHLDEAVNIPIDEIETASIEAKPSEEVVVYCRSGVRAQMALGMLQRRGFKNVSLRNGTGTL